MPKLKRLTGSQILRLVQGAEKIASVTGEPVSVIVADVLGIQLDDEELIVQAADAEVPEYNG